MQILLLSLLVLLILIGQIYKIIYDKKKMSQEAFDMVNKKKHQEEYWKNSIRYYNSLGDKRLQNTIEQIEKNNLDKGRLSNAPFTGLGYTYDIQNVRKARFAKLSNFPSTDTKATIEFVPPNWSKCHLV